MGFFVFVRTNMKDNDWKNRWKNKEMDQFVREDKRQIKKRNHKSNRRSANDTLKKGDYESDNLVDWKDLGSDDR